MGPEGSLGREEIEKRGKFWKLLVHVGRRINRERKIGGEAGVDKEKDLIKIFAIRIFGRLGRRRVWIDVVGWVLGRSSDRSMVGGDVDDERGMREYDGVIETVLVFA